MILAKLPKIALFIADLGDGGAECVFVTLARAFSEKGYPVDLVAGTFRNATFLENIPPKARLVDLQISRMALGGQKLIRYFQHERPGAVLVTRIHSSCLAVYRGSFLV